MIKLKLKINEGCIGCGMCEGVCSSIFSLKDDGKAQVDRQPEQNELLKVKEAIEICPVGVIELSNW